uniref:Coiled-coil domain-containing protein n=1 Tax=Panagrellus redivivus TaxID=6233 RepID=A0A7E4VU73_PANRE
MGKKLAENTKAVEARARKAAVKEVQQTAKAKAKEDAQWADDDKNLAKKAARKEEEERKRLEALRRKQENKEAYEEDMKKAASGKSVAKTTVKPNNKVTMAMLLAKRDADKKAKEEEAKRLAEAATKIEVPTAEIEENLNRVDLDAHTARTVDDAIKVLDKSQDSVDRHPEKRLKALYTAFETTRIAQLKAENPNLRLSQLKQMAFKEWQKSPENPLNAKA